MTTTPDSGTFEHVERSADLVPIRMFNKLTYCSKLGYMEWVLGEFAEPVMVAVALGYGAHYGLGYFIAEVDSRA